MQLHIIWLLWGKPLQTPEIRQSLKISSLVQREIEKDEGGSRDKDKFLTKILFS